MAGREQQSVPWFPEERPQEVLANGVRLDGRSFEEFRNVCEWPRPPAAERLPPRRPLPPPPPLACRQRCLFACCSAVQS